MMTSAMALLLVAMAMNEPMPREQAVTLAKETVSQQARVPAEQLAVESATIVDWPDSSLGCPQPGMMYAQMITPGFKVILVAANIKYAVHIGSGRAVICNGPGASSSGPKAKAAQAKLELIQRAREKLSATLQVDMEKIQATLIGNAKPTCGGPGAGQKSAQVVLDYDGRQFIYDAASDATHECEK